MAKKIKVWQVKLEYVGKVCIESVAKNTLLDGNVTQDELALLAENPIAIGFLEQVNQTENEEK